MDAHRKTVATLAHMQQALDLMPPLRRAVFLAVRHEQLTFGRIAERHAITAAQVEHELTEALVTLVDAADGHTPTWRRLLLRVIRRRAGR